MTTQNNITNSTFTINAGSIDQFCPDNEAMVYGFEHCDFDRVRHCFGHFHLAKDYSLRHKEISLYTNVLGYDHRQEYNDLAKRMDGRKIHQINAGLTGISELSKAVLLGCKAALVNMVLENYQSQITGKKMVPIIFCIDITNNRFPLTSEDVLSKTKTILKNGTTSSLANDLVTHKELRRAYKLCHDPMMPLKFREVAKESFKFVRVEEIRRDELSNLEISITLQPTSAPWEAKNWDNQWAMRKSLSHPATKKKTANWRKEVLAVIDPSYSKSLSQNLTFLWNSIWRAGQT